MRKLLMALTAVLFFTGQLLAQKVVTGKVTDDKGNPVPNASVLVKGTSTGTTTKTDGTYSLNVPAGATTLVFSSVSMGIQEVPIGSGSVVNATLTSTATDLTEVVVTVPYGTVKKTAFTGSEGTITAKTIEKQQVTSVTRMLEGLVPGVISTNGGGQPGSGASVIIRGIGSYNASSAPLYVLDGVAYDGSISALSTDEIESVTVLKDAAAAALYGARAANGVIMITTKRGKKGRPAVSLTVRNGYMSRAIPEYDRVSIPQYYELMWEGIRNDYLYAAVPQTPAQAGQTASNVLTGPNGLVYNAYNVPGNTLVDPATGKLNPNAQLLWNDSWEDALYRTAGRQNVNLNVSGANDKTDYFLSFGYLNEDGIVKFTGYERFNARLNVNAQATNWLRAGLSVDGSLANQSTLLSTGTFTSNPFYYTRIMGPIYPVWQRDASGNFIIDPTTGKNALDWGRPDQMGARPYAPNSNLLGSLELDDRSSRVFNGNANAYIDIKLPYGFNFKTTLGTNFWDSYGTTYQNNQFGDADNVDGRSTKSNTRQLSLTLNEILSWSRSFGDHNVKILGGHENYRYKVNSLNATRIGFPFPGTSELDNAATAEGSGSSEDNHRIDSWLSNVSYDYQNRYLLSASFRADGSSRFHPDTRWGQFWSVGLGWRISQEKFMQNIDWVSELKLRASYGEQGNESIPYYYAWQPLYELGWNNGTLPGAIIGEIPNPEMMWETNQTTNIGVDFGLFRNRLQGTIEYFNRVSDNLLFLVPLAPSVGARNFTDNVGTFTNKGIEVSLGYNVIRKTNFDWRIDLNLTHFKNEITKLPQEEIVSGAFRMTEGGSRYDFWLREFAGVDASTGEALYYKDVLDSDGKPTGERMVTRTFLDASYYNHGTALPDFTGGLTNSFRYKNFDLSILLTFSKGGQFLDQNYQALMHRGTLGSHLHADILNRWQKPGDITNVPKIQSTASDNDGTSTRFLFDGSYLNIKNVTLSYTLPRQLLSKLGGIAGLQIFANVDNAWLFTKNKGMDPQRSISGTSDFSYTPYRTMTVGLNLNL